MVLYVGTHHKTGAVLCTRMFTQISDHLGLKMHHGWQEDADPDTDVIVMPHSRIHDPDGISRGIHLVRHPFNLIRSAYRHHLTCREAWAIDPEKGTLADGKTYGRDGISYQDRLRALPEPEGLVLEMQSRSFDALMDAYRWDYSDRRFKTIRFENMMADFEGTWKRAFNWLGLPVGRCLQIARRHDIARMPAARIARMPHVTDKTRQGHKVAELPDACVTAFRAIYPADIFARLGYPDPDTRP